MVLCVSLAFFIPGFLFVRSVKSTSLLMFWTSAVQLTHSQQEHFLLKTLIFGQYLWVVWWSGPRYLRKLTSDVKTKAN